MARLETNCSNPAIAVRPGRVIGWITHGAGTGETLKLPGAQRVHAKRDKAIHGIESAPGFKLKLNLAMNHEVEPQCRHAGQYQGRDEQPYTAGLAQPTAAFRPWIWYG
jgi:hypothetical protein